MLRKLVSIKTELADNLLPSEKIDAVIKTEEEMKIEIKQEIILPSIHKIELDVVENYKHVEEDLKIEEVYLKEFKEVMKMEIKPEPEVILSDMHRKIEKYKYEAVKQEELIIKNESDENYDDLTNECSKESNNSDSRPGPGKKLNGCFVCSKTFSSRRTLKDHMKYLYNFQPFIQLILPLFFAACIPGRHPTPVTFVAKVFATTHR